MASDAQSSRGRPVPKPSQPTAELLAQAETAGTPAVVRTLAECEQVIERGLKTFVEVGTALLEIRERRLYREAGYSEFDTYTRERWGWSESYATRQIQAAEVAQALPIGNGPNTESQARELVPLKDQPEQLQAVWQAVIETAPEGKVTAAHVRDVVQSIAAPKPVTGATTRPMTELSTGEIMQAVAQLPLADVLKVAQDIGQPANLPALNARQASIAKLEASRRMGAFITWIEHCVLISKIPKDKFESYLAEAAAGNVKTTEMVRSPFHRGPRKRELTQLELILCQHYKKQIPHLAWGTLEPILGWTLSFLSDYRIAEDGWPTPPHKAVPA